MESTFHELLQQLERHAAPDIYINGTHIMKAYHWTAGLHNPHNFPAKMHRVLNFRGNMKRGVGLSCTYVDFRVVFDDATLAGRVLVTSLDMQSCPCDDRLSHRLDMRVIYGETITNTSDELMAEGHRE